MPITFYLKRWHTLEIGSIFKKMEKMLPSSLAALQLPHFYFVGIMIYFKVKFQIPTKYETEPTEFPELFLIKLH